LDRADCSTNVPFDRGKNQRNLSNQQGLRAIFGIGIVNP